MSCYRWLRLQRAKRKRIAKRKAMYLKRAKQQREAR